MLSFQTLELFYQTSEIQICKEEIISLAAFAVTEFK